MGEEDARLQAENDVIAAVSELAGLVDGDMSIIESAVRDGLSNASITEVYVDIHK